MPSTGPPILSPAYSANSRWMVEHLSELERDYPNQWVAIHAARVVAADPELGIVTARASSLSPPDDTVFHFVDDGSLIFAG